MRIKFFLLVIALGLNSCQPGLQTMTAEIHTAVASATAAYAQPSESTRLATQTSSAPLIPGPLEHRFKLYSDEPVLSMGEAYSWDSGLMDPGAVVYHKDQFHMFYDAVAFFPSMIQVGYATSQDGIKWTRVMTEPVFTINDILWQPKPANFRMNKGCPKRGQPLLKKGKV